MLLHQEWVPPELFMTLSDGRKIYHTYKDGYDDQLQSYWYTTDGENEDTAYVFDVRELSTYFDDMAHEEVIQTASTFGELKFPE